MKILILVLSAYQSPFKELYETSLKTWDSIPHPDCETVYYFGSNGIKKDNTIVIDLKENYQNMSRKTWLALKESLNYDYDYLFRVNSSSFVHKENLVKHIKTLPESIFQGLIAPYVHGGSFMWGPGYTISRDVVEKLVSIDWNYSLMDDVSISFAAHKLGIKYDGRHKLVSINRQKDRYLLLNYGTATTNVHIDDLSKIDMSEHYQYRCKQDGMRKLDLKIMKQLYENIT